MGLFDVFYCPNTKCEYSKPLKENEKCPLCGSSPKKFGISAATNLSMQKKAHKKIEENGETQEFLISDEMTDEEIKTKIAEDMMNLAMHEAGTSWMRLGTLLSFDATQQMLGAGFKALIDQNKIIIRQNELLLRALTKKPNNKQKKV